MAQIIDTWTVDYAVERVTAAYGRTVAAVIETGRELIEAKAQVPYGQWLNVVARLPFSEDKAQLLMQIASNDAIANADHGRHLPSSWRTLSTLAVLPPTVIEAGISYGTITPGMVRSAAEEFVRAWKDQEAASMDVASSSSSDTPGSSSTSTDFNDDQFLDEGEDDDDSSYSDEYEDGDENESDQQETSSSSNSDTSDSSSSSPSSSSSGPDGSSSSGSGADAVIWTAEETGLKAQFLMTGKSIVINMRTHKSLWAWAQENGHAMRVDRATRYGNPFETPADGTRDEVIAAYRDHYLPFKPSIRKRYPELRGKVLACWCYPEACHGDVLIENSKNA